MKVRQWAWLLLAGAVAPFVFDNGPDPSPTGSIESWMTTAASAMPMHTASFASRPDLPLVYLCERRCQGDLERSSCGSARVGRRISSMGGWRLVLH